MKNYIEHYGRLTNILETFLKRVFRFSIHLIIIFFLLFAMLGEEAFHFINPKNTTWMLQGDLAFQFFAWNSFLANDWQWPIGSFQGYLYQSPINLFLADAIPWWSVFWKIVLGKTQEFYQFTGLWFLLCCILQVHSSYILAKKVYPTESTRWIVTVALSFAPFFISRIGHPALCAQFLILYAFVIVLESKEYSLVKSLTKAWLLTVMTAGIHPYFLPMLAILFAAIPFTANPSLSPTKKIGQSLLSFTSIIAVGGAVLFALGAQSPPTEELKPVSFYVGDVFIFFNSMDRAYFPKLWHPRMGQIEGFAYLGFGWMILFVIVLGLWIRRKLQFKIQLRTSTYGPLLVSTLILGFWSLGENIRFFGQWLISIHYVYEPFYAFIASFRAAGRFVWPLAYLLILLLPKIAQSRGPRFFHWPFALGFILFLQLFDISKSWFRSFTTDPGISRIAPEAVLSLIDEDTKFLDLMPPDLVNTPCRHEGFSDTDFIPLARLAHEVKLPFNSGNRANPPFAPAEAYCLKARDQMHRGDWEGDRLYVFESKTKIEKVEDLNCRVVGRWNFCRKK